MISGGVEGTLYKTTDVFDERLFWAKDPPGDGRIIKDYQDGLLRTLEGLGT